MDHLDKSIFAEPIIIILWNNERKALRGSAKLIMFFSFLFFSKLFKLENTQKHCSMRRTSVLEEASNKQGLPVPDHTDDVDEEIRRVWLAIDAVFSSPQRIAPSMIPPTGGIKDSWPIVTWLVFRNRLLLGWFVIVCCKTTFLPWSEIHALKIYKAQVCTKFVQTFFLRDSTVLFWIFFHINTSNY